MRTVELLAELRSRDIKVWAEGEELAYDAPTGALTPDLRDELVKRKAEILALLQQAAQLTSSEGLALEPVARNQPLALSSAQRRLWFLDQLEPDQSAFNLAWAVGLNGSLDVSALAEALGAIVDRHEVLRTTFATGENGEPIQVIAPAGEVELERVELANLAPDERDTELQRQMGERAVRPFDLATGPLLRATLYQLAPDEHVLALTIHHIAFDGWSFGVFARELGASYAAFAEGREPALPELPLQYADYAAWQQQRLQGEALETQLDYWRRQLGPELPVLELPTDNPRPAQQSFAGARESHALSKPLLESLRSLSQREGVTLFMTLTAALKVLLHRYSGQSVITIGTPVANRTRSALEPLIGFFVNSLVLSTKLTGELSFREALARLREVSLGAFAHQDLPFEQLVEAVRPERDLSRHPLFQVLFALQNVPFEPMDLPGLRLSTLPVERPSAQLDLSLFAREEEDGLRLHAVYNTDLFEAATIRRLLDHYETLLARVVADPAQAISRLPLQSEDERAQLLAWVQGPAAAEQKAATLSGLIEAQARRTPDAAAIVFEDQQLSYRALDERSSRLARHLAASGVGPGSLVGICLERSADMVEGLLGILKTGAAYVPLDPGFPAERLAYMLADAEVRVLVTQESLRAGLPAHQAEVVSLDGDAERIAAQDASPPDTTATPEDLAYVIYTSGSTGKPKGVEIPHRAVVNFLTAMQREPGLGAEDVLLTVTTLSFDISVLELYLPLICGARVVVASRETAVDGEALLALLDGSEVTVMQATPTTWRLLLETGWSGDGRLKALVGGEAWGRDLAAALNERCGSVWNMYGPTETTIWSAVRQVQAGDEKVLISGPIANTRLYVLDEHLEPAPIGVPGELFIGGTGLARGYLNRPELTAERFVPDPFDADGRLYRTGDQVRYRGVGSLEFMGRLDHQVKLRGYRIELGEIEAVLATHPEVQQAVVLVREDVPGDQRLVAYLMADPESDTGELRSLARERLPDYMVPTAWVTLAAFPLTLNRKVDRKALPAPEGTGVESGVEYVAPRTPHEEALAEIWAEVLGLERVGTGDDFFQLGGHSLLATQVVARVRDGLSVELPLRALFEGPTVAELARRVATLENSERGLEAPPLVRISRDRAPALSFAQQRLWFLDRLEPDQSAFNLAWAIGLTGGLEVDALERALSIIVDRHEVLRTTFATDEDDEPIQVIAPAGGVDLERLELANLAPDERDAELRRQMGERGNRPFDLATGPVLRVTLYRLAPEEHVLALTVHHIAFDGWSFGVLARELGALYAAIVEGREPVLPELPIQYADHAAWQRQWLQGDVLEAQLDYWRRQLGPNLPVLELPTDHPRPAQQSFAGDREGYALPAPLLTSLRSLSQREGVTLFMTLAAALKVLFHRYSGQSVITIGTPVANRTRSALEPLIGFFVNSLVLSTELEGELSFREALARVREVSLGAYAHQDLPFEQLVEAVSPQRDQSRHPLFQVAFALQNAPFERLELPGLRLSALPVGWSSSQFDLTLFAQESGGGLKLVFEYNTDLFEAETIRRLLGHYETLLAGVVTDPAQAIAQLPLLREDERGLLREWNATRRAYPVERGIHECFEAQAARTPEAVALVFEEDRLTYAELNGRANQLARHLRVLGVGPDVLVGLCVDRSLKMVVGILGILKAGGAYVPLDTAHPQERLSFILEDARVAVLLTQASLVERFAGQDTPVICLDTTEESLGQESIDNPRWQGRADSPAYVIYTSGSTGKPKGVLVSHANVVRLFAATRSWYHFDADDVWTLFHSYAFDFSVWELWGALFHGGKIVVVPYWASRSPEAFHELLVRERVTVLNQTPSAFRQLIQADEAADGAGEMALRLVIFGGEALDLQSLRPWFERHGDQQPRLVNMYGITETTVHVTYRPLTIADVSGASGSLIGRPIPDLQVCVLDRHLQPVPIGVPGEMYVGGAGLALGYLNRPELTAERFLPNSFTEAPDARLYKTGDLVRFRSDGDLEYLGRIDQQVKIRGFRIELGEIEAVLGELPTVRETAVVVREDSPEDKRLVAYVVSAAEPSSPRDLRKKLKQRLPEYMIPAHFVMLDALPLTPNGKLDRRALPDSDYSRADLDENHVAPRDPVDEILAQIWEDLLRVEQVGVHDNFFDLGGHSLLAAKIVTRLRASFGVDIPLRAFFDSPTIAGLSEALATARRGEEPTDRLGIAPVARDGALPLSFAQERFWLLDQIHTERNVFNFPSGFRMRGPFRLEPFRQSVQALVDRHEVLRTTFPSVDGEPHQVIAAYLPMEVPIQNCSGLSEAEQVGMIQQAFHEEKRLQFDLAQGPLLRTRLLRFAEDDHCLVLNLHHIINDAWSLEVIINDLVTAYTARCKDRNATWPALPIQYVDYAHWQRELVEGPAGKQQLAYWKNQLAKLPPALPLPTDYARPAAQTFRGARENLQLPAELIAPLRSLNRQEGTTLFMVLLAALQFLLHRLTGTHDILVGSPIAGRDREELQHLIGCFLNTLVLRTDLSGDLTGRNLLKRVREVVLNAYENQDVPFERILAEVDPVRDPSRTPVFQVLLNMHIFDDQSLPLPELSVTRVPVTDEKSLFDMTLYFTESANKIVASLAYNADLFTAGRMKAFMQQFRSVLEQMINEPDRRLEAFTLVTPSTRSYLPDPQQPLEAEWEGPVWGRLECHALEQGEAVAIAGAGGIWTYQDLEARSNRLAHHLLEQGVKAQEVVAVYAARSPELVLALLGVLKAGAAFMVLDPAYPPARLLEMLQITRPRGLVHLETAGPLPNEVDDWAASVPGLVRLPTFAAAETDCEESWGSTSESAPEVEVRPDDLAYVAFTSGSTGTPKCLLGTHRPLSHFVRWYAQALQLTPTDRVTMFSGLSHDPLLRDVFTPLWIGGALCIPDEESLASGRMVDWMKEQQVTLIHLTPPLAEVLTAAREPSKGACTSLRYAVFGGDSLRPVHLDCIKQLAPQARCVNAYGATETPQIMSWYVVPPEFSANVAQVPIGQGIDGVQVLVLNNAGQPAGIGELGEIHIRTPYLTQGYVNDEALTSARFLRNPFRPEAGDRIYRTGDRGRLSPDGSIEFAGRKDFQVKIRGFRVEVGEVEAALNQHPAIRDVVVVPGEDSHRDRYLAAYLETNENLSPSISEIRSFLQQKLPEYMIPSVLVFLDALPRTPNGKVDYRALPRPDLERSRLETEFVAPSTTVEKTLAKIWGDVLDLERVGVHDSFFEVGGHSLHATRVMSRACDQFEIELPLLRLFETPTIAGLAELIEMIRLADQGPRSHRELITSELEEEEGEL